MFHTHRHNVSAPLTDTPLSMHSGTSQSDWGIVDRTHHDSPDTRLYLKTHVGCIMQKDP